MVQFVAQADPELNESIGGASVSEMFEPALFIEPSENLGLWDINDSLKSIPAFDTYCSWDTENLFDPAENDELPITSMDFILANAPCDFVYPACGHVTSPFGYRRGRMHYGCDIDLETGDEVQAAFEGMVRISQFHHSYGNVVVVRHNNGLESLYAHLSRRMVAPGDYLEAGDLVGLGGNTGRSYGAHLHFELRYLGHPIDPSYVLNHSEKSLKSDQFKLFRHMFGKSSVLDDSHGKNDMGSKSKGVSKFHVVRRGDTLSAIARKNHTSVSKLCKLNSLRERATLQIGQRIKLR